MEFVGGCDGLLEREGPLVADVARASKIAGRRFAVAPKASCWARDRVLDLQRRGRGTASSRRAIGVV